MKEARLESSSLEHLTDLAPPSQHILGLPVHPVSMVKALQAMKATIKSGRTGSYVCLTNAHTLVESQSRPELRSAVRGAFLSVPDGMPLVWMLRRRGFSNTEKITGVELMPLMAAAGRKDGLRHFLYGGSPGVAERTAERLVEKTGANVVGIGAPPFAPIERWPLDNLEQKILATRPDVMWVGLGAPRQEIWMSQVAGRLRIPLMVGVGAAFDFLAGSKRAAPRWVSDIGLEWLFRLASEPKRLWRRYLLGNPKFVYLLARERFPSGGSRT